MLDELAIYNLSVKYPNTIDLVREVERIAKAEAIDKLVEMLTNDWGLDIILAQSNKEKLKSFIVSNGEQLKEQNNE